MGEPSGGQFDHAHPHQVVRPDAPSSNSLYGLATQKADVRKVNSNFFQWHWRNLLLRIELDSLTSHRVKPLEHYSWSQALAVL